MSNSSSSTGFVSHFRLNFIAGVLVSGPFLLTGWLLFRLFVFVDGVIRILPESWQPEVWLGYDIPGLGIALSLLFVYLSGVGTRLYAGRQLIAFYEALLEKVPFINGLYQAIKQLMTTLFSEQAKHFQDVVLVEYPRKGMYCFAFLTNERSYLTVEKQPLLSIFLPSTPNPTTGFYLLLPVSEVLKVDMSVEEAFKVIMSAGIVTPEILRTATPFELEQHSVQDIAPNALSDANESPPTMM